MSVWLLRKNTSYPSSCFYLFWRIQLITPDMDHMRIFSCNIICNFFRVSPLTWMWYETEIHGNGCRRHLPLRVKIFNAIFSRIVSMCVCFLPLLLSFCGITKITVSTYLYVPWVCACVCLGGHKIPRPKL